jgi:hypothetical protein
MSEDARDPGAAQRKELRRRVQRAAGGDEVIDKEQPLAGADVAPVHLEHVLAVLQREPDPVCLPRELSLLSQEDQRELSAHRVGGGEYEAARFYGGNTIDG